MNHIGTLSEKSIHAQLKVIFQPDDQYHEVKVGRYIADICIDQTIIEIQTSQLYKMEKKLKFYLENGYEVTVVHPIIKINTLHWCSLDGEIISSRKTTKNKAMYQILFELLGITEFIGNPLLTIKVLTLQTSEVRMLDGYGKDKKNRATKLAKGMDEVLGEVLIRNAKDVKSLLPEELDCFTATQLGKIIGLKSRKLYFAVHALENIEIIKKIGKEKRADLWQIVGGKSSTTCRDN